jgi:hypothetical protein
VLFRRAVRRRFDRLHAKLVSPPSGAVLLHLARRCEAAKDIVQAFIQAPVRLSLREGYVSSLIVFQQNHWWWITAAEKINALWRRIDAMFIAQIIVAVLAWVFAIIANFWSLPGQASSNSAEWQICMGTLWLWLVSETHLFQII